MTAKGHMITESSPLFCYQRKGGVACSGRLTQFTKALLVLGTLLMPSPQALAHSAVSSPSHPKADTQDVLGQNASDHVSWRQQLLIQQRTAWSDLRASLQWHDLELSEQARRRVDYWVDYYTRNTTNTHAIARQASPWLAWITHEVKARGLPGEIALIPFIESSFDPMARSHLGAAGLWQFMPATGQALGLKRSSRYDGRLDVLSATQAALDYVELQADQWYEGDLLLSLAAYNAGAGTVNQAVRRAQHLGKTGHYWDLKLPRETMHYVPKLIALSSIIADPERHGVDLPDIDVASGLTVVELTDRISIQEAARRLNIAPERLSGLNPGFLGSEFNPADSRLIALPANLDAQDWQQALASRADTSSETPGDQPRTHRIAAGESLYTIAARYNLDYRELRQINAISNPRSIQPGQTLKLGRF